MGDLTARITAAIAERRRRYDKQESLHGHYDPWLVESFTERRRMLDAFEQITRIHRMCLDCRQGLPCHDMEAVAAGLGINPDPS